MIPLPRTPGKVWPRAPSFVTAPAAEAQTAGLPRISIVIPSLDQGRFLESALRSVLLQGYPDLELMVVDGGSHDESRDVIDHYRTHLAWSVSAPDRGQAHAINIGFARATGSVLGWLNADDILLPGSLMRIGRAFARRPHLDAVAGFRREVDMDGNLGLPFVRDRPTPRHLRRYCCLAQETVYLHRRVYDRIGGLDEARPFALDYEYWLRMLASGYRFTLLPAYLGGMRDHPHTKRATRDAARREDLRILGERYNLGINEEDAWMGGGGDYAVRLALLEDLCRSPMARYPRLTLAALHVLDTAGLDRATTSFYERYRHHRPRDASESAGRIRSGLAAAFTALRDALRPRRPAARQAPPAETSAVSPLLQPRLAAADLDRLMTDSPFVADTLALGDGWSWPERTQGGVYRWAFSGADLLVLRPSGGRRTLRLTLESGPSIGWQTDAVALVDEAGRTVARGRLEDPRSGTTQSWQLDLPLAAGPAVRRFRIHIDGAAGHAASDDDPRVLDFRATDIAWQTPTGTPDATL